MAHQHSPSVAIDEAERVLGLRAGRVDLIASSAVDGAAAGARSLADRGYA